MLVHLSLPCTYPRTFHPYPICIYIFYGLNLCRIPEFIYSILNPQCDVIWRWGLFKVFRL